MSTLVSRLRLSRLALVAALGLMLVVGFSAGLGYRAVRANPDDEVEACVNKYTGAVRMNNGQMELNCSSAEIKRTWGGIDYSSIDEIYFATHSTTATGVKVDLAVQCPAGYDVLAGGSDIDAPNYYLKRSAPNYSQEQWLVSYETPGAASEATITAWAVCALWGAPMN